MGEGQIYSVRSRLLDQFLLQGEAHLLGKKLWTLHFVDVCHLQKRKPSTHYWSPHNNFYAGEGSKPRAGNGALKLEHTPPNQSSRKNFYFSLRELVTRTDGKLDWEIRADREPLSYLKNNAS